MSEKTRFLSVNQVSEALGTHRVTISRWIEDGTIPSVKLGGRRLIPSTFLETLEQSAAVRTSEAN